MVKPMRNFTVSTFQYVHLYLVIIVYPSVRMIVQLTPKILEGRLPQRQFTIMASRRYGRLFKQHDHPEAKTEGQNAPPNPQDGPSAATEGTQTEMMNKVLKGDRPLKFSFSPDLDSLVNPNLSDLVSHSTWIIPSALSYR